MELGTRFNTTTFTKNAIHETEFMVLLSIVVTSLVCWLFLGSWSSTLNVLFSIPTSILGTFVVIYFLGFTLNFFTLLGLSLAVGIVVDDAIMVLENIFRHFQMGKDKIQASLDGAREITFAALAATVSIVAVFSPVLFINGQIGAYLYQFGVTISAAVVISLLEAITLTPMRCSQFMQRRNMPMDSRVGSIINFSALPWDTGVCLTFVSAIAGSSSSFPLSVLVSPFTFIRC